MNIGERIKEVRKYLDLNQTDFAEKIGLKQAAIGLYENGQRAVADRTIMLICQVFNISEKWLRDGKGSMLNESDESIISDVAAQYKLGELDKEVLKIFLELSPDKRETLKDFAFALVDSVLNNDTLYMAYHNQYIGNEALPFAARNGDTSNLDEAAELFDGVDTGEDGT